MITTDVKLHHNIMTATCTIIYGYIACDITSYSLYPAELFITDIGYNHHSLQLQCFIWYKEDYDYVVIIALHLIILTFKVVY